VEIRVPIGTQVYRTTQPIRVLRKSNYHPAAATEVFSPTASVGLPFTPGRAKELARILADQPPTPIADGNAEPTPPSEEELIRDLIADLTEDGQRFILAKGGRGGRGNVHFKSSKHQAPREFEFGEPGEELWAELELKTIADVGLVGYPNAGKSTLISKITHAHPKIASYPFTTLTPNVGIITFDDDFGRIRVADIPGLIEGAHSGKGLGHDFLRHIERCKLLIILLDMAGVDGRKPADDYQQLLKELELYNPEILRKPRLVVANKMDLPAAKKNLAAFKKSVGHASSLSKSKTKKRTSKMLVPQKVLQISALATTGLDKLKLALRKMVS
jgi:Obg family GTPase CgtA